MLEHEQHARFVEAVLHGKKSFGGIVGLELAGSAGQNRLKSGFVGREGHAAVHKELKVGPHGFEGGFAPDFENAAQQNQHPTRNAKEGSHVLTGNLLGNFFNFGLPLVHQSQVVRGGRAPARPKRKVVNHDRTEVSVVGMLAELVDF